MEFSVDAANQHFQETGDEDVRFFFPHLDGAEMRCRWDMQDHPPDILITNYSMLGIMLMRDVDKNIFEKMILQEKRVDKEPFIKFLKLRAQISQGQINNDQFEDNHPIAHFSTFVNTYKNYSRNNCDNRKCRNIHYKTY